MKKIIFTIAAVTLLSAAAHAWIKCPPCNGTGWQGNLTCFSCGGDGKIGQ